MKFKLLDWVLPIITPMEMHAKQMLESILNQVKEQTGSRLSIYKGQMLYIPSSDTSDKLVLLPDNLKPLADDYLAYVHKVEKTKNNIYGYLCMRTNNQTIKQGTVLAYLPQACHYLFDATAPTQDIPDWLDQVVNESLMLRALYEMS